VIIIRSLDTEYIRERIIVRYNITTFYFIDAMGNKNITLTNHKQENTSLSSKIPLDDINIIWLGDKSNNNQKFLTEFRQIVNSVHTFTDPNLCEEFLKNDVNDKQIIFLILFNTPSETFITRIHELTQIDSIYILCHDTTEDELWVKSYSKLKGNVFIEVSELYHKLKQDIDHCQNDLIRIHSIANDQLNQLEPDFMYSQLLKETLINIEYDENAKKEFIDYCISQSNILNSNQMNIIDEFNNDYEKHSPIWWYTRHCFVYEMLNKALRTENIDILIKMGFFIRDLHRQIQQLYSSQEHCSMIVYRGQGMTSKQFEHLCKCKGGLISFQNFLSTSLDKQISLKFARRAIEKPGLRGIIFRMKINQKMIHLSNPYALLNKLSYFKNREKEILFSTHTVFRIENIEPMKTDNKISLIDLKLTSNQNDQQLELLTKYIRHDVQSLSNPWERLAKLMLTIREFDKAQQIYENILQKTSLNDYEQLAFIYHQLGCVHHEKTNLQQALFCFEKSVQIKQNYLSYHSELADTYLNIGSIYHTEGNLDQALEYFQHALQTNTNDQTILASIYNNIGMVLKKQGQFVNALQYFEKSLQIDLHLLPPTHPDLATTYSNIGTVYFGLKDYLNARFYYQKTLDIRRLSLPKNHPALLKAIENYQNTIMLVPINIIQSASTVFEIQYSQSKLSKRSRRLTHRVSDYVHTIKRKH
jgi:tetratricopeptide (TPR) repeat protein